MHSFTFHIVAGEEAQRLANIWHSPPFISRFQKIKGRKEKKEKAIIYHSRFWLKWQQEKLLLLPKITGKHCFVLPSSNLGNVWSTFTHTNWPESTICRCHFSLFFPQSLIGLIHSPKSKSSIASKVARGHFGHANYHTHVATPLQCLCSRYPFSS